MKTMIVLFAVLLLFVAGQLQAQNNSDTCVTPSWMTTVPMKAWMPPLCSTITIQVYDAGDGMRLKPYTLTVLGYWNGGYNNIPLVFAQTQFNPMQVWLIGEGEMP